MMQSSISKKFSHKIMPAKVGQWFLKRTPTRQVLVFIPTLFLLSTCFSVFKSFLLKENILTSTSQTSQVHAQDVKRVETVAGFRRRVRSVLLTTTSVGRGVTFSSIDVLSIDSGHPVFDEAALAQIAGRVGRSASDPKGEVIFFYQVKTKAMKRTNQS